MAEIFLDHVLQFISLTLTDRENNKALTPPQIAVVRGAWEGLTSTQLAMLYPFTETYLRLVSSMFWREVSEKAGHKITKKSLREFIETQRNDPLSVIHDIVPDPCRKTEQFQHHGVPLDVTRFKGRLNELKSLQGLLGTPKSVFITGMQGIGKSALAAMTYRKALSASQFKQYVWHPVGIDGYKKDLTHILKTLKVSETDHPVESLLTFCQTHQCFMVLDGIDPWLNAPGIDSFMRKLIEFKHESQFLFTSRYPLALVSQLEQYGRPVSTFHLGGLTQADCVAILSDYQLSGANTDRFLAAFQGNPRLIHKACRRIQDIFGGNIDEFFTYLTSFASDEITQSLDQLFGNKNAQLTETELFMLAYLATQPPEVKPTSNALVSSLQRLTESSLSQIVKSIEVLRDFSLITLEKTEDSVQVAIPRTVRKYLLRNVNHRFPLKMLESSQA